MRARGEFKGVTIGERMPGGWWWGNRKCEACHARDFEKLKRGAEAAERGRDGVGQRVGEV